MMLLLPLLLALHRCLASVRPPDDKPGVDEDDSSLRKAMRWEPCLKEYLRLLPQSLRDQVKLEANVSEHPAYPGYFFEDPQEQTLLPPVHVTMSTLRVRRSPQHAAYEHRVADDQPLIDVWLLPGGPGQSYRSFNPSVLLSYLDVFEVEERPRVSIYVPQLRMLDALDQDFDRVEDFYDYLQANPHDDRLASISTELAAQDVLRLVSSVEESEPHRSHVDILHGLSYGGLLGLEVLRLAPNTFQSFVFDTGASPYFHINDINHGLLNFLHEALQICRGAGHHKCPVNEETVVKAVMDPNPQAVACFQRVFKGAATVQQQTKKLVRFLMEIPSCVLKQGDGEETATIMGESHFDPAFLALAFLRTLAEGASPTLMDLVFMSVRSAIGLDNEKFIDAADGRVDLDGFSYGERLQLPDGSHLTMRNYNHFIAGAIMLGEMWTEDKWQQRSGLDSFGAAGRALFGDAPEHVGWFEKAFGLLQQRPWFQRFRRYLHTKPTLPPPSCTTRILFVSSGLDYQTPSALISQLAVQLKSTMPTKVMHLHVPAGRHVPLFRYRIHSPFLDLLRDFVHDRIAGEHQLRAYPQPDVDWDLVHRFFYDSELSTSLHNRALSAPQRGMTTSTKLLYVALAVVVATGALLFIGFMYWLNQRRILLRQLHQRHSLPPVSPLPV